MGLVDEGRICRKCVKRVAPGKKKFCTEHYIEYLETRLKKNSYPLKDIVVGDITDYTCFSCSKWRTCPFSFDLYNTNGDCLAEK